MEITKCSSRWSEPKPKSWRTHAEDFEKSIHEDDDEMIELAKRIEMSATPGDKSPPTRARKLNIRETHQYDDYGGALFTEEERELLGTSACCSTPVAARTDTKQTQSSSRKTPKDPSFEANSRCQSWTALPWPAFPTRVLFALASESAKLSTPAVMLCETIGV